MYAYWQECVNILPYWPQKDRRQFRTHFTMLHWSSLRCIKYGIECRLWQLNRENHCDIYRVRQNKISQHENCYISEMLSG